MSSKIKPTKTSGSSPVFSYGDYTEMSNTLTQQDYINMGAKFKHSVMKMPFADNKDYPSMEFAMSPGVFQPVTPQFPSFSPPSAPPPLTLDPFAHECVCGGCMVIGGNGDGAEYVAGVDLKAPCTMIGINTWAGIFDEYDCECNGNEIYVFHSYFGCSGSGSHLASPAIGLDTWRYRGSYPLLCPGPCKGDEHGYSGGFQHLTDFIISCEDVGFTLTGDGCKKEKVIKITTCGGTKTIIVKKDCGECLPITIVNENGSPATDTILRNGTLDFKTTGNCCEAITWTVTVDAGSTLGGSTISDGGVLTAGATSCGSLKVTASCPACGTSATQYVRVTNAGQWILIGSCLFKESDWLGSTCRDSSITYDGKYQYMCRYKYGNNCFLTHECVNTASGGCVTKAWCDANGKTKPPCTDECCWCNEYSCSGDLTGIPCFIEVTAIGGNACVTEYYAKYEWKC